MKKSKKISKFTGTVHNPEPDYTKPLLELSQENYNLLLKRMTFLYGEDVAEYYMPELLRFLRIYYAHKPEKMTEREKNYSPDERFTEEDIILITYGDIIRGNEHSPLATLAKFCDTYLEGTINTLHILPFYPYSSDRGFSVIDFETVDPKLGSWEDIENIEERYQLMFDGVFNHISSKSRWFQEFLDGSPYYRDFFISYKSKDDLSQDERAKIFRPRTSDILTKFYTIEGVKYVWTTFSQDQVDLNFRNPNVLLRIIDTLLMYARHGADIIRLDAVTFLWAEPGTQCIHLDETHEIVKLTRDILNITAPTVALITETNVPHEENISYFGNGSDEAQMVYNFALPPLVLHTIYSENAAVLSKWATDLETPTSTTTFFNFLDSHDGVGLMAVKNLLTKDEIEFIIKHATNHGGLISYKTVEDGSEVPYEINITWFSAINGDNSKDDISFQIKRFIASRAIALVIPGVPGIYLHGLIGTKNDVDAVTATKSKRDINRKVIDGNAIDKAVKNPSSIISRIGKEYGRLMGLRVKERAFHPNGPQKIMNISPKVFSSLRISPELDRYVFTLTNISSNVCEMKIPLSDLEISGVTISENHWYDIVNKKEYIADDNKLHLTMEPYDVMWLEPFKK